MIDQISLPQLETDISKVLAIGVFAFVLAMIFTPIYTWLAYRYRWWKGPRSEAVTGEKASVVFKQQSQDKNKRRLPTMAGIVIVGSVALTTVLLNLSRSQTYLPLAAMLGAGVVGLFDDVVSLKSRGKRTAGLNFKIKFSLIFLVALLGGLYFYYKLGYDSINITFFGNISIGWLLIPLFTAVVVSTANAVNITDGLDGLSGGLLISAYGSYAAIALLQEHIGIAGFCLAVIGALLAYVWFNIYPARFMMGDVGSFSLGTGLGVIAMLTDTVPLLILIGGIFVLEAGSSMVQIISKKLKNGKKIFLAAPVHHHFVALGWPETKVTMRFWVLGQVLGVLGVILAVVGGHV